MQYVKMTENYDSWFDYILLEEEPKSDHHSEVKNL